MHERTIETERDDAPVRANASELADEASGMVRELRDEAESKADRWTHDLGKRGAGLARALGTASATLRDEGDDRMAELADRAAEQVERMSGYLEREDPRALMDDLEKLGGSNPAAFLGTAFAAGILSGRFFRASSPEDGNGSTTMSGRTSDDGHDDRHDDRYDGRSEVR